MMKKILLLFVIAVFFLTGCESEESSNSHKREIKEVTSLVCTMTEEKEEEVKEYIIELSFYEGKLITKKDTFNWSNSKKESCDFYKKREEIYNEMAGVRDTVTCSDTNGTRTTIYTISELIPEEVRIAESRYIRESGEFDYSSYKTYRQNEGYHCVENH